MIEDGGPAFPAADRTEPAPQMGEGWNLRTEQRGMSLRDYFAAYAMLGILSNSAIIVNDKTSISSMAYQMADEMLKARKA